MTYFISYLYATPPLIAADYIADAGKGMGIITPAYAQVRGSGNDVLSPILPLWKLARNISYLAMIFIFLVIGFMIMFRQKINPQTVISAQSALPGLVVGLILITFSYFLAALVVDVTFVSVHLVGKVFEQEGIIDGQKNTTENLLSGQNIFSLFSPFIVGQYSSPTSNAPWELAGTTAQTLDYIKQGPLGTMIDLTSAAVGCYLGQKIIDEGPLGGLTSIDIKPFGIGFSLDPKKTVGCIGGSGIVFALTHFNIAGGIVGLLLYIILIIALLIAMFKTVFGLITSYISILINTVTAPLQFLLGSIPGRQNVLGSWIKNMLGNLMVFPAVFAALLFAAYLLKWQSAPFNVTGNPGNFTGTIPLLGNLSPDFLRLLLAYGVLLMVPSIPDAVKGAFGIKDNPLFGKSIIGGFMGGMGVSQAFYGKLTSRFKQQNKAYTEAKEKEKMGLGPTPTDTRSRIGRILP